MKVGDRRADWRPEPCVVASREAAGDRPGRRGLTLLEVLLATALSVVLLAALYAVLHLQYRYWTRLDVRTQQTQLTRSLYVMLQADLRGCVFRPPEQEDSGISTPEPSEESAEAGAGAEVGGTVEDEEVVVGVSDPLSAWGSGLTGLVGTADVLVLQTAQTESAYGGSSEGADEFDALAAELGLDAAAGLPESPTLRAVAYCTGDSPGGAEFVQSLLDGGATVVGEDADLADLGPLPGLYRVSAPFSVWENSGEDAAVSGFSVTTVERLAPEVRAVGFRYFDGAEWLSEWDSIANGRLPSAVEITLTLRGGDELERMNPEALRSAPEPRGPSTILSPTEAANDEDRPVRIVIWLPAAEPVESETAGESAP